MRQDKLPFIHLFRTAGNFYLYDVNTDKILQVPESVYVFLNKEQKYGEKRKIEDENLKEYINMLKKYGFLKSTKVKKTEHPETKFLQSYVKSNCTSIILQVTQNCNLRCDYCVYSGSYYNRKHNNKRMKFELAKSGIDYLAEHSADVNDVHIGFYGGEPLLEFDLIKKCIDYAEERLDGKNIYYNLTTNGTLITDKIVNYFEKYGVLMMISLDGPKQIHDASRRTIEGKGTYDLIIKNVRMIKEKHPEYYNKKINFNTVINTERGYKIIADYIAGEELFKDSLFKSSLINPHNSKMKKEIKEQFAEEILYEHFMVLLSKVEEVPKECISVLSQSKSLEMDQFRYEKNRNGQIELPQIGHHSGPCVPGNYRIFMNAYGDFYPCERVSENCDWMKIGNIDDGLDVKKISEVMNIEKLTEEKCHNCWAYKYCRVCVANINTSYERPEESILEECTAIRSETENKFKDYCVLKLYEYQY